MNLKQSALKTFIFIFIVSGFTFAQTLETHFQNANKEYKNKNYEKALSIYTSIEKQGLSSSELFFNIGNTYYRLNNLPIAIVYNERAYKLSPRNENIRHNREFYNALTGQKYSIWHYILSSLSLNEAARITFILYSLFFLTLFLSFKFYPRWLFWLKISSICLGILFFLWTLAIYSTYSKLSAVVSKQDVNVYSGPNTENIVGFTVPLGRKVSVESISNDWIEIGMDEESLKGWIKSEDAVIISKD
ncbi:hypothetical protein ACFL4A_03105 [bacterium]